MVTNEHRWCVGLILFAALVPLWSNSVYAQDVDESGELTPEHRSRMARRFESFGEPFKRLGDWDRFADHFDRMVDDIWARNRWTSESDQFAKHMIREMERIPPWQVTDRLDRFADMLGERYEFNTLQGAKFKTRLYAESFGLILGNADLITRQVAEFVETQADGTAITPEQVKRWTEESEPLMQDMMKRVERLAETARSNMKPEQRALFERDYESFHRRMDYVHALRRQWKEGQWNPGEWGAFGDGSLMRDGGGDRSGAAEGGGGASSENGRVLPVAEPPRTPRIVEAQRTVDVVPIYVAEDDTTWARWVRWFIAAYELDAGQRDAVESILTELETRAERYRAKHAAELAAVPVRERAESDVYRPLRDMFDELKNRAMALLNAQQRSRDLPPSEPSGDNPTD